LRAFAIFILEGDAIEKMGKYSYNEDEEVIKKITDILCKT